MSEISITGKIINITPTVQKTEKFSVRELWVETRKSYPGGVITHKVNIQFSNKRTELLNAYEVGSFATVHFNVGGRAWTSKEGVEKVFNTLDGWKLEPTGAPDEFEEDQPVPETLETGAEVNAAAGAADDDLPF